MKSPLAITALLSLGLLIESTLAAELTIYSSRQEQLIKPLMQAYEKETGTNFVLRTDKDGALIERLKGEGKDTPADLLFTVDAGNLWQADQLNLLTPASSAPLKRRIPEYLRDPENHWFGLSVRARTIFFNPTKVKASELTTYEDLAEPKWKGRLCLRTSKKVYNQSLVASLIDHHGEEKAEQVVQGWVNNLATKVFPNDTSLLKAIDSGQCDVGVANTYYFGRLLKEKKDWDIKVFWPNQSSTGVHVNISGAGIVKASKNKEAANRFLEWLSQPKAQEIFAGLIMEYPAVKTVDADPMIKAWGKFKQDTMNVERMGELQASAVKLMDRVGYK